MQKVGIKRTYMSNVSLVELKSRKVARKDLPNDSKEKPNDFSSQIIKYKNGRKPVPVDLSSTIKSDR